MQRLIILLFALLALNTARAEDFSISGNFGLRLEGIPNALSDGKFTAFYPNMGFHLALEAGTSEWRGGLRFSLSTTILFLLCSQMDVTAYLRYNFSSGTSVYGGVGRRTTFHLFDPSWTDWHALLGVRFTNGAFIELMPGIATGRLFNSGTLLPSGAQVSVFIVSIAFGWSWDF